MSFLFYLGPSNLGCYKVMSKDEEPKTSGPELGQKDSQKSPSWSVGSAQMNIPGPTGSLADAAVIS